MQTFLPLWYYEDSAAALDNKRLNKQRVECLQIYNAMQNPKAAWANHPAVRMWSMPNASAPLTFLRYWDAICAECDKRGFKDNAEMRRTVARLEGTTGLIPPFWLQKSHGHCYRALAYTHAVNLLRKDSVFYSKLFHPEALAKGIPFQEYLWPCGDGTTRMWRFTSPTHKAKEFLEADSEEILGLAKMYQEQVKQQ